MHALPIEILLVPHIRIASMNSQFRRRQVSPYARAPAGMPRDPKHACARARVHCNVFTAGRKIFASMVAVRLAFEVESLREESMGKPLWDAQRHDEYVRQRDAAIEHRTDRIEGTSVARDIDATWALLPAEERQVLEYLVLCGARSCIAGCEDPLLSRLVERGMLSRPAGVRPALTDDLVTMFRIVPALWAALAARRGELLSPERDRARLVDEAAKQFGERLTPIACADAPDPSPSAA